MHQPWKKITNGPRYLTNKFEDTDPEPAQLRWHPFDLPKEGSKVDFLEVSNCNGCEEACVMHLVAHSVVSFALLGINFKLTWKTLH